jgi:hypothetical protein
MISVEITNNSGTKKSIDITSIVTLQSWVDILMLEKAGDCNVQVMVHVEKPKGECDDRAQDL